MGRIKSYAFTKILYLGLNDDVPDFDDDTLVVVVNDGHPFQGQTCPFNGGPIHEFMED